MEWIKCSDKLPDFDKTLEISDDANIVESLAIYTKTRSCMLASISGFGFFDEGFATDGSTCERGLILDTPIYWRYKQ